MKSIFAITMLTVCILVCMQVAQGSLLLATVGLVKTKTSSNKVKKQKVSVNMKAKTPKMKRGKDKSAAKAVITPKTKSPLEVLMSKPQVQQQIGVMLLSTVASRLILKLDFKNTKILTQSRMVFIVYIVGSQLLFTYIRSQIEMENNEKLVRMGGASALAGLPIPGMGGFGGGGGGDKGVEKTITVKEHDLAEVSKLASSVMMEMVTTTYMHLTKKAGKPLLFVPLMGVVNKLRAPVVQIYVFNRRAKGHLARPFKAGLDSVLAEILPRPDKLMQSMPSAGAGAGSDGTETTRIATDSGDDDGDNVAAPLRKGAGGGGKKGNRSKGNKGNKKKEKKEKEKKTDTAEKKAKKSIDVNVDVNVSSNKASAPATAAAASSGASLSAEQKEVGKEEELS